jgi:hypothetical protein
MQSSSIEGSATSSGQQETTHDDSPQDQAVSTWLFVSAALVFGMVVVGGITRLTESGLSITDWKPLVGVRSFESFRFFFFLTRRFRWMLHADQAAHVRSGMASRV